MTNNSNHHENPRGIVPPMARRRFLALTAATAGTGAAAWPAASVAQEDVEVPNDIEFIEDEMVEMRDGTQLATDIYLPNEDARPAPTLVSRTPYNKAGPSGAAVSYAEDDYAVAVQDVRGKFASEGSFHPYRSEERAEHQDGYDAVEWAADQEWSNGRIGMYGASALAESQMALLQNEELPPSLETMVPAYAVSSYYMQGAYAGGACLWSHNLSWLNDLAMEQVRREDPNLDEDSVGEGELTPLEEAQEPLQQLFWDLPIEPFEPYEEAGVDWLTNWHTNETFGEFWEHQDYTQNYDKVDVPILQIGGWYDIFAQGTVQNYTGTREEAATQTARNESAVVMGPHTHGEESSQAQGFIRGNPTRFPENSTYSRDDLRDAWFDHHLKDDEDGSEIGWEIDGETPARLYVPGGLDEWVGGAEFPFPETEFTKYYLHSDGDANIGNINTENLSYGGRLTTEKPGDEPIDEYTYDPADPVITPGGYNTHWLGGIADRTTAYHNRNDILLYQTDLLEEDVAVVGPITVTLYASTSAVDTDFIVNLSETDPTDRTGSELIAEGARRGRIGNVEADPTDVNTYRDIELLESDEIYAWKIAVWPTSRVFSEGNRIRVDITSSDFPRYDRNQNTGEGLTGEDTVEADQTVYHDDQCPSHIELPIVPMGALEERIIDEPFPGALDEED
jgi:putative CocE/NonD family hydrolase